MKLVKLAIVDDEEIIRESLEQYFLDYGFSVLTYASGVTALNEMPEEGVDLGIVDIRMPGMSGEDFVVAAQKRWPQMKFLIQTGTMDYRPGPQLVQLGITTDHVLKKPVFDLETYVIKVCDVLRITRPEP